MYKNAEKVLNDKEGISKSQVRNAVAKARIELNVRKISTMIHLIQPPSHDEVILPKNKNSGECMCACVFFYFMECFEDFFSCSFKFFPHFVDLFLSTYILHHHLFFLLFLFLFSPLLGGEDGSPLDGEEMQKLRSEEQKMKIRLMKSAAMVPMDAVYRPLDKRR